MGTFFVAGVHGVGKTDLCTRVAKQLTLAHYTASAMIKALDSSAVKQHTKAVDSVPKNQDLLIQAVTKFLSSTSSRLILDGHFAVLSSVRAVATVMRGKIFRKKIHAGAVAC
jgi:adenylate kinase